MGRIFRLVNSTLASKGVILAIALLLGPTSVLLSGLKTPQTASAAPSTYLNFQARLLNSSGNLVPDGLYNIEFKIYDAASSSGSSQGSCTGDTNCKWVETRYDSNGVTAGNDNRVNVVNGYFSVNLGSINAFSGIDWSSQLWLTMNIGGSTQTATPTYDGQMTPRIQLTAVPLAFVANNVASGSTNAVSTNSNDISIATGNAAGTTSNSGNISIDSGTATGTTGSITLGATNASALILGRTGLTTTNTGSLSVTQTLTAAGTGTGLSVTNNATIGGSLTVSGSLLANGSATGTTGTSSGVGGTNVTTITLASAGSFANNDVILVDNTGGSGQDYYTRIVSGGGTTTLTVSPAVSYGTAAGYTGNATITKYTVQSIGATSSDYTTLSNRFFQGYFLGGIVTGAGSTIYSDGRIQSSNSLNLNATAVNIQNTADSATALQVKNAAGTALLTVDTTNSGVIINPGVTFNNQGATLNTASALSDFASGGVIGTAAATVNTYTTFTINQSTVSQALTLPNPTVTTAGRIVYILNIGSVSFTMHGVTVVPAGNTSFIWNGSAWSTQNGGASIQLDHARAYNNANSSSIANSSVYTLALNAERYDNNTIHDNVTNNTRMTIQKAGYYLVTANIALTGSVAGGRVDMEIHTSASSAYLGVANIPVGSNEGTVTTTAYFNAGDYVYVQVANISGSAITLLAGNTGANQYGQEVSIAQLPDYMGGGSGGGASGYSGAEVYNNADLTNVLTNNTDIALTYNSERQDTSNYHSTSSNTGRLVAPISGMYYVHTNATVSSNATGARSIFIRKNGTSSVALDSRPANAGAAATTLTTSTQTYLNAGDYLETLVNQNSGSTLSILYFADFSPNFGMSLISGSGGGGTLQSSYDAGNSIATTNARDITFTLADTATDANLVVNVAGSSSGLFAVQGAGVNAFTVNGTGQAFFKNTSNSASALRVQNFAGSNIFSVDTTAGAAVLGQASTQAGKLTLQNATNANTVSITSGATTASYSLTLPVTLGTTGQCLKLTDNSGTLIFADCGSSGGGGSGGSASYAKVYNNASQNHTTNGSWQTLAMNSEESDTDGFHDTVTNNSRVTALTAGLYQLNATIDFAANATGVRGIAFAKNGAIVTGQNIHPASATTDTPMSTSTQVYLNAGDYVEVQGYQTSGGTLAMPYTANQFPYMSVAKINGGGGGLSSGAGVSYASVAHSTTQNIANGTFVPLMFDSEYQDTDGYHAVTPCASSTDACTKFFAPTSGFYNVTGTVRWVANTTGIRVMFFTTNNGGGYGYQQVPAVSSAGSDTVQSSSAQIYLNAGDWVQMQGYQNSGGTLTLVSTPSIGAPLFAISKVGGNGGSSSAGGSGQLDQANAYKSTTTVVTTGAVVQLALDTERFDNGNIHSTTTNTTRFTAGHSGTYAINANIGLSAALAGTGYVQVGITKNGSSTLAVGSVPVGNFFGTATTGAIYLNAGDYVEMEVFNNSTGSVTLTAISGSNQYSQYLSIAELPSSYGTGSGNGSVYVGAEVYNNANLTNILTNNAWTSVTYNTERQDTGNIHDVSTNTSRLVASVSGMYYVHANAYLGTNTTGSRMMGFVKNGGTGLGPVTTNPSADGTYLSNSTQVYLNAGDYIENQIFQNSGSAMTVSYADAFSPNFGMSLLNGAGSSGSVSGTSGGGASFARATTTSGTIANATWTVVPLTNEDQDTDGYHDNVTNNSRFTVPSSGFYHFTGTYSFATNTTGERRVAFGKNGTASFYAQQTAKASASYDTTITSSTDQYLNAGDYIEMKVFQDSGTSLASANSPEFTVFKVNGGSGGSVSGAGGQLDQARVYNSANSSSITTGTSLAPIYNSERYDNNDLHSTSSNTDRFTIKHAGYYSITSNVGFLTGPTNNRAIHQILKNGTDNLGEITVTPTGAESTVTTTAYLNAGDYITANIYNASTTAIQMFGSNATTVQFGQDFTISQLPDSTAGGISLQSAYDVGNTITSTDGRDLKVTLADTTIDANLIVNIASGSTSRFAVQYNGVDTFSISNNASSQGAALFKNAVDNNSAFQIQDAAGNAVLRVDTINDLIVTNFSIEALGQYNNANGGIGQTQNLVLYSEQFDNAAYTKTNVTATANAVAGPDNYAAFGGNTAADTLTSTSAGGTVAQTYTTTTNGSYNYSVWVKAASGTQPFQLRIDSTSATPTTGTAASFIATSVWQRFNVTQAFTGTPSNIKPTIIITNNSSAIYAYGAQLSQSTLPLVYSRTTATVIAQNYGVVSNGGLLAVSLNATDTPLTIVGAPSQSGSLVNVQDSAGNSLLSVPAGGGLTLNTTTGNNVIGLLTNGTAGTMLGVSNSASGVINGSAVGDLMFRTNAKSVLFSIDAGTTSALSISTGNVVGINGTLTVTGSSANINGNFNHYKDLASYSYSAGAETGAKIIALPTGWTNTMMKMTISGYEYNTGATGGAWSVEIGGYNYSGGGGSWINYKATIKGRPPFSLVRLAYNGTKNVVILGDIGTVWQYPKISVDDFYAGYTNITGWGAGWTITNTTSLAGISLSVTASNNVKVIEGAVPGSSCDQSSYDICATAIGINGSIYSYGKICAGNPNYDCSGTGGAILQSTGKILGNALQFDSYGTWLGGAGGGAAIVNSSEAAYEALMVVGNTSSGTGRRNIKMWDDVSIVNGSLTVYSGLYAGLGVANTTSTVCWDVATHQLTYSGNSNCAAASDERLKTNITTIDGALDKLSLLKGVTFNWQDPNGPGFNADEQVGVIAQDVLQAFPQLVKTSKQTKFGVQGDYYSVNYEGLIGPTIQAVNELNTIVKATNLQVQNLNSRLGAVEAGHFGGNITAVGNVSIGGNLDVTGDTILTNLKVTGITEVAGLTVGGGVTLGASTEDPTVVEIAHPISKRFKASKPIAAGSVVILDATAGNGWVTTTTTLGNKLVIGITVNEAVNAGDMIEVAIGGTAKVTIYGTAAIGNFVHTDTHEGKASVVASPLVGEMAGKVIGIVDAQHQVLILVGVQ